jgi:hypothetical protein
MYSEAVKHQLQQLKTTEEQVRSQDAGRDAASTSAVEIQVPGHASLLVKRLGRRSGILYERVFCTVRTWKEAFLLPRILLLVGGHDSWSFSNSISSMKSSAK